MRSIKKCWHIFFLVSNIGIFSFWFLNFLKMVPLQKSSTSVTLRIYYRLIALKNCLIIHHLNFNMYCLSWACLLYISFFSFFVLHIDFSLFFEEKFYIYLRKKNPINKKLALFYSFLQLNWVILSSFKKKNTILSIKKLFTQETLPLTLLLI